MLFCSIAVIQALFDIWFIGDHFVREVYNAFRGIINAAKLNKKSWKPYLLDYYNSKGYYYQSNNWLESATSWILNKLTEALNENDRLPKYIVMMPDKDIIADLNDFEFGATKNIANLTNWLMRQCEIMVHRKKLQIMEKKPGAVIDNHPTFIYVNMIRRLERYPRNSKMADICKMRSKFNQILNEGARKQEHKIINLRSCYTIDDFDRWGNLTPKAITAIWHEIDNLMDRYEDPEDTKVTLEPYIPYT